MPEDMKEFIINVLEESIDLWVDERNYWGGNVAEEYNENIAKARQAIAHINSL